MTGDLHITLEEVNIIHLIYVPEGNSYGSFVFQRVLMFPSTLSRETSGLEEKKNLLVCRGTIHQD